MERWSEELLWAGIALVLVAFAVPWFLWGTSTVVAGLPVWVWWHVGWLALTSLTFAVFSRRAWGLGVEGGETRG